MRARNIKPGFFMNELLAKCDPLCRIFFEGLWCAADREGRIEYRPERLKAEILPYDTCDVNGYFTVLSRLGFILLYDVHGKRYIQVINFKKHQTPHHTEKQSELPAITEENTLTVNSPLEHGENPPDSLIPDSYIGSGSKEPPKVIKERKKEEPDSRVKVFIRWWCDCYAKRFPGKKYAIPNGGKLGSQVKSLLKSRLSWHELQICAGCFLDDDDPFIEKNGHDLGLLLTKLNKYNYTNKEVEAVYHKLYTDEKGEQYAKDRPREMERSSVAEIEARNSEPG